MPLGEVGSVYGNYRIDDYFFPVPITAWVENQIGSGLNGIPVLSSFRIHTWSFSTLEAPLAKLLFEKYEQQQTLNSQLDMLETDPYDASLVDENYGTQEYTNFVIVSVGARSRNFPNYDAVEVVFEVYVG